MVVVDASAILELLKGSIPGRRLLDRLGAPDYDLGAPHLIDAEVLQTLRRWTLTAGLPAETARRWLDAYQGLAIHRYPHGDLVDRAWELRANLNAYDALYLALAEGLGRPLVTADARLSRATGHRARIQVL